MFRIGQGYDVHKYASNRDLILGGIKIPFELGLSGHSDADVLTHAVMDALIGALALGDIGKFLALIVLVLQLAASGGTFPVETINKGFQVLTNFLPMTYAIRLLKESLVLIDKGFAM